MSMDTIKAPFQLGYCDECYHYTQDGMGSRQCELRKSTPIRKIKECNDYIPPKIAKMLEVYEQCK